MCPCVCVVCCCQGGFPEVRVMLCIGGIDMRTQLDTLRKGEQHTLKVTAYVNF